jgi:hypothetical protein
MKVQGRHFSGKTMAPCARRARRRAVARLGLRRPHAYAPKARSVVQQRVSAIVLCDEDMKRALGIPNLHDVYVAPSAINFKKDALA